MKSRNLSYIPQVDHLRLVAALLVFAFHFFHFYRGAWRPVPDRPWFGLIVEGHTGVSLFFVLSGFIFMTMALGGGAISYKAFLRNRLLRIAPLFLTVFMVAISIGRDRFEASDILYLLFSNIGDPPTSWHFVTGPAWSISVEFTFYLVFPFLAAFALARGMGYLTRIVVLMLVVKSAAYVATENSTLMLYSTLIGRFDQFVVGMLSAMIYARHRTALERRGRLLLAASVVLVLVAVGCQSHYASFFSPDRKQAFWIVWGTIEAALWAAVVVCYLAASFELPGWIDAALRKGGEWSFSIYMWHALVIYILHEALGPIGGISGPALALNGLLALAAVLAFAWLSFTVIEHPFLEMRVRYRGGDHSRDMSGKHQPSDRARE